MPKIIVEQDRSPLGINVRDRRKELGMTQAKLAEMCGLRQSRIAEIETGASPDPPGSTVLSIARALGTTSENLYEGPKPTARKRHKATA